MSFKEFECANSNNKFPATLITTPFSHHFNRRLLEICRKLELNDLVHVAETLFTMIAAGDGDSVIPVAGGVLQILSEKGELPEFLEQALILGILIALEETDSPDVKIETLKMYAQFMIKIKVNFSVK